SQHRSQDMGVAQPLGGRETDLILVASAPGVDAAGAGFFAGVDTTLTAGIDVLNGSARETVETGVARYRQALKEAAEALDPAHPWAAADPLAVGLAALRDAASTAAGAAPGSELARVLKTRVADAQAAVLRAGGITLQVVAEDDLVVPGETVDLTVELWNGGDVPVRNARAHLELPAGWGVEPLAEAPGDGGQGFFGRGVAASQLDEDGGLAPGALARWRYRVSVPRDAEVTDLYFRERPRDGEMYRWPDDRPDLWGLPKRPAAVTGRVDVELVAGGDVVPLTARRDVRYVGVDKATGQFETPMLVTPAVSVAADPGSMVWPVGSDEVREVRVRVTGQARDGIAGQVRLEAPEGWSVSPTSRPFDFGAPGEEQTASFRVRPTSVSPGRHTFRAVAEADDGRTFDRGVTLVDYPHIERTAMVDPATLEVSVFDVAVAPVTVGYLMGSGDDGMLALEQMGVDVREVTPAQIASGVPPELDVLVLGIRVYETRPEAAAVNDRILDFARQGGTVIVQYNKYEYPAGGFAPYPVSMGPPAPRVTDEDSPVEILTSSFGIATSPNTLGTEDFEGWVQERGLYFLADWDDRFEPVLSFTDPGEEPALGGLVVAPVGDGLYVYTGISFFRQFPAGVPGAHRLFANLVSLGARGGVTDQNGGR
ncbi:MAG TPA: hypothetical protein VK858_19295, partial [Longimicrobiales bacterium]|nr:hypothetical protein [Longimicrobiales bacterium]